MRIRLRGPAGSTSITLAETATWGDLKREISAKTSILAFELKYGYPPKTLDDSQLEDHTSLSEIGVKFDGEQLIVVPRDGPPTPVLNPVEPASNSVPKTSSSPLPPLSLSRKQTPLITDQDIPSVPIPSLSGRLILRIMPDDNSCLFRALSYALLGPTIDGMTELRSLVAQRIQAQPEFYSAAVLGKNPDAYCRWIQREASWGGGIEMAILSQEFDVEVCSINVQDLRVDRFNEGKKSRCILVYSGIHYDVVALTPYEGADPGMDKRLFDVIDTGNGNEHDNGAVQGAREICKVLQEKHYYTDIKAFGVVCNVCGWNGNGSESATKHAKETGHMDFGES